MVFIIIIIIVLTYYVGQDERDGRKLAKTLTPPPHHRLSFPGQLHMRLAAAGPRANAEIGPRGFFF